MAAFFAGSEDYQRTEAAAFNRVAAKLYATIFRQDEITCPAARKFSRLAVGTEQTLALRTRVQAAFGERKAESIDTFINPTDVRRRDCCNLIKAMYRIQQF
jgi:hypothetical protein